MESQINSLEARIEKMQEGINKDLEEIIKSQYIMNNAISEIKNTLDKGAVFCMSEVIDISPGNPDSSLCSIQPSISHDVLCI